MMSLMSASEFGHAIGVPGPGEQQPVYQPSYPPASYPGASYTDASPADELDLSTVHAQARQKAEAGDLTGARTMLEEALASGLPGRLVVLAAPEAAREDMAQAAVTGFLTFTYAR